MFQRTTTFVTTALLATMFAAGAVPSATTLEAQLPADMLLGRVLDADGEPVVGAEIRLGSTSRSTTTDRNGLFRVPDMPSGLFAIGVRLAGYYPVADLLRFPRSLEGGILEYVLDPLEVDEDQDTLSVQSRRDAAWSRELKRYELAIQASRQGVVTTAEDIAERQPLFTSDLFMRTPGFRVVGGGQGARVLGSRGQCIPSVFLDDQLARGFQVNDIPPEYIRLMVAYRGVGGVPSRYQNPQANANCGTIALFLM